jgi:ribosomal protein S11
MDSETMKAARDAIAEIRDAWGDHLELWLRDFPPATRAILRAILRAGIEAATAEQPAAAEVAKLRAERVKLQYRLETLRGVIAPTLAERDALKAKLAALVDAGDVTLLTLKQWAIPYEADALREALRAAKEVLP